MNIPNNVLPLKKTRLLFFHNIALNAAGLMVVKKIESKLGPSYLFSNETVNCFLINKKHSNRCIVDETRMQIRDVDQS